MGYTLAQKILSTHCNEKSITPGKIVWSSVDMCMTHENAWLTARFFDELGSDKVFDSSKIVVLIDHKVPANNEQTATNHTKIREFVKKYNLPHYYDIREGICHQVLPEKGHVSPGTVVLGTDSHTCTYGAFGAFSSGIGVSEMACVFSKGKIWFKVPETFFINIENSFSKYSTAKDLMLHLLQKIGADGAHYQSLEFGGAIDRLSISQRMTLSNMSVEAGAKVGLFPADKITLSWLKNKTTDELSELYPEDDVKYDNSMSIDLSQLEPLVACPHSIENVKPVLSVDKHIDQAFIGSCTNGRLDDLAIAADILKNKTIDSKVRLIITPASKEIYLSALEKGYIETFVKAGAIICNPNCGPCIGTHQGVLAPGEVCVSTTNRNFCGRMGSTKAEIFVASPAVVAASALTGSITHPQEVK